MDADAKLREQRTLVARILDGPDTDSVDIQDCTDLAQSVRDLDEWLSRAGALPGSWRANR
jgi:hypothetical protein